MAKYNLLDNFYASGTDLDEFKELVDEISSRTDFVNVKTNDVRFFAFEQEKDFNGKTNVHFWRLSEGAIDVADKYGIVSEVAPLSREEAASLENYNPLDPLNHKNRTNYINKDDGNSALVDDMEAHTGLMVMINGILYYTSPGFRNGLVKWANAGCAVADDIGLVSNLMLAKGFKHRDRVLCKDEVKFKEREYTVVARHQKDEKGMVHHKGFGLLSDKYSQVPTPVIYKAVELLIAEASLGKVEVRRWEISQDFAEIICEFPDAADSFTSAYGLPHVVVPGLRLCTSDTGSSSVIVEPTYRIDNGTAIGEEVRRVHRGAINEETILQDVNEDILTKMRDFPEQLCERMSIEIGNEDLSTKAGRIENKKLVYKALMAGMKELKMNKILGTKRMKLLRERLKSEIKPDLRYTEYDIAVILMNIPERISIENRDVMHRLSKACGRAANVPFSELAFNTSDDDADIAIADAEEEEI